MSSIGVHPIGTKNPNRARTNITWILDVATWGKVEVHESEQTCNFAFDHDKGDTFKEIKKEKISVNTVYKVLTKLRKWRLKLTWNKGIGPMNM